MFDQATGNLDAKHRGFFAEKGDARQVWARRQDGSVVFLKDGGVNDEIRDACRRGDLTCPMASCPDPRFVARGGQERRHHFAHVVAHLKHANAEVWRSEAATMLAEWAGRHSWLDVTSSDDGRWAEVAARSQKTGHVVRLRVTYDRRAHPDEAALGDESQQLLIGHTRALLLPREVCRWRPKDAWWCGAPQLLDTIVSWRGYALAVNPEKRLVATIIETRGAKQAKLLTRSAYDVAPLLCILEDLADCRLSATGIETRALAQARESGALQRYQDLAALRLAANRPPASPRTGAPTRGAQDTPPGADARQAEYLRRAEGLDDEARLQLLREMFLLPEVQQARRDHHDA
jgi:hypothetical protein